MRITPATVALAARAYDVKPAQAAPLANAARITRPDTLSLQSAPTVTTSATAVANLVSGSVVRAIDFDHQAPAPTQRPDTLALYTRAADKVEAATAVHVGRMIDLSG